MDPEELRLPDAFLMKSSCSVCRCCEFPPFSNLDVFGMCQNMCKFVELGASSQCGWDGFIGGHRY